MAVTREDIAAELKRRGYKGQLPGQEDAGVSGILKKFVPGLAEGAVNAASVVGGGKPIYDQSNSLDKQYKLAQINALNNKQNNLVPQYDEAGNVTGYTPAPPGHIIPTKPPLPQEAPEGYIIVGGKLVKDPSYKREATPEERAHELQDDVAKSELTNMSKLLPRLDQASQAASQLKELYSKAVQPNSVKQGDVVGGILNRFGGLAKSGTAMIGTNPELNRFKANRQAFSGLISKGGFGEAGMLTEQDISRIASIIPDEYSTKEEADIAWNEISTILNTARQRFEQKRNSYLNPENNTQVQSSTQSNNDFSSLSDEELQKIANGG